MGIEKQFTKYVSQNILGTIGVSCYIIADTFFISKAAGADGITVLNLALPIYNLIFAIGSMTGIGAATRFAILRAQGNEKAQGYFSNAVFWVCLISVPFILAGILAPERVMALMGADARIISLGRDYNRIFLLFTPFFMLNFVISAFVRNDGAPSLAMVATIAGSLFNIIFDYVFMFPMGLGLAGAAFATAASPVLSILICGTHFFSEKNTVQFLWRKPSARMWLHSCQLGIPAFIGEMSSGVTTTVFNFLILGLAGNTGVAAYGVIANYALVATAVFNGVSQGMQPLLSRSYGKGNKKELKKLLGMGITAGLVFAGIIYAVVYAFTDPLVSLFNSGDSVLLARYAFEGMRLYFIGFIFAGFNIIGAGYLSATAHPKSAFITSFIRGVAAIIACSVILSRLMGFTGVWISFAAAEGITAVITAFMLIKQRKKHNIRGRSMSVLRNI